jgi:hypothetical protein
MAKTKKTSNQYSSLSDVMTISAEDEKVNFDKTSDGRVVIDDTAMINVKSNVFGELFFVDPVTKEEVSWPQCGETQVLTMGMLRHMKTGAVKFFVNNLVVITGFADANADKYETADIYKALSIQQYYKNYLDPTHYEDICSWTPSEIKSKTALMSQGAKQQLIVALNTYIEKGVLDSLRAIKAFEEALDCELGRPE